MKRGVLLFTRRGSRGCRGGSGARWCGRAIGGEASHNVVGDGVDANADDPFLESFPYVAAPNRGYDHTGHE